MDTSKIKAIFVSVLAAFAALYLGVAAATAQVEVVLWVVGICGLAGCLLMGRRIWLLIPFMGALSLKLPLPGNFSTGFIAQGVVLGFCLLLFLMRRLPMKIQFSELEAWCGILCVMVAQAYLRNPVGLNIFGSSSVGGKPYAIFAIAIASSFVISLLLVQPRDLIWRVRLVLIGSVLNFIIGAVGILVPSVGYYLGASFSNDARGEEEATGEAVDEKAATRVSFVAGISGTLAYWVTSKISPVRACFHPLWAPLVLISFGFAAFSGFRSQIAIVGLTYLIGIMYRGGLNHLILASTFGALGLSLLAIVNATAPLPPNIQRSLTILPGTWEQRYKDDAKISTAWRTEMWIEALRSDRYIRNKWLGDGLGMSAEELARGAALMDAQNTGHGAFDAHREAIMINGDFHSGPVQTIKTIGYLGLLVLLIGMVRLAVHAHRQILRCRGTEWFYVALFIGIPLIATPFFWTLVFGDFTGGTAGLLTGCAWVRMLEKNLPLPEYVKPRREPYVLMNNRVQKTAV